MDKPAPRQGRAFEEVVERVRGMLSGGELKPGERLPPEREFSRRLNISRSALRRAHSGCGPASAAWIIR